jgi:transcriptional regulator with XRE-family HTH domain
VSDEPSRFNSGAFFGALESTAIARGLKWKDVSQQTGVSTSTLSRMAQGKGPDAASLALLSAWAGLNPAEFTNLKVEKTRPEPLARLTSALHRDPRLSTEAAKAMEEVVKATYERLADRASRS